MSRGSRILTRSVVGLVTTAALVYFFDPARGAHRRQRLRKQGMEVARRLGNRIRIARLRRQATRQFNAIDARLREVEARL